MTRMVPQRLGAVAASVVRRQQTVKALFRVLGPHDWVLHLFEALLYAGVAALCIRRMKIGYTLGVASGAFWLWSAWGLTTFVKNGFQMLALSIRIHQLRRPDLLIAVPAWASMVTLVVLSVWGYALLSRKSTRDLGLFVLAFVAVAAFYVAIEAALSPRFLEMFKPVSRMR
jgi:hypothetical protein